MNYYINFWKNAFNFEGRARRAEYWMPFLFNIIITWGLLGLAAALSLSILASLSTLYRFVSLVPAIAVAIRRMHDVDKSGWYMLIPIYNFILAVTEGTKGDNQYGSDPKANA